MRKKRLSEAVKGLDPGSRALLDLSLRRRIPDEEIADFLGIEAAGVARRRAAALRRLGIELEIERPEQLTRMLAALAALPADAWGVPSAPGQAEPADATGGRVVEMKRGRRAARSITIAGVPLTALGVLLAMIIAAGNDETATETGRAATGQPPAPVLGEVPTPPADEDKGGDSKSKPTDDGDSGTQLAATGGGTTAPVGDTAPTPEPQGDTEVRGRREEGSEPPETAPDEPDSDPIAEPEPTPAPAPAPAPAPQPAPAPAPPVAAPPQDDGGDGGGTPPRAPTEAPADGPRTPLPEPKPNPEPVPTPTPPKGEEPGGGDDGDGRRPHHRGDGPIDAPGMPQGKPKPGREPTKAKWKFPRKDQKQGQQQPGQDPPQDPGADQNASNEKGLPEASKRKRGKHRRG